MCQARSMLEKKTAEDFSNNALTQISSAYLSVYLCLFGSIDDCISQSHWGSCSGSWVADLSLQNHQSSFLSC